MAKSQQITILQYTNTDWCRGQYQTTSGHYSSSLYHDLKCAIVIGPTCIMWCAKIKCCPVALCWQGKKWCHVAQYTKMPFAFDGIFVGVWKCTLVTNLIILGLGLGNRVRKKGLGLELGLVLGLFITVLSSDWTAIAVSYSRHSFNSSRDILWYNKTNIDCQPRSNWPKGNTEQLRDSARVNICMMLSCTVT